MPLQKTILKNAAECFAQARGNVYEGMKLLYEIYTTDAWKGEYDSFKEYVSEACDIKYPFAMRLISVWNNYVVQGHIEPVNLKGIDIDRLALASRLEMPAEKQLAHATNLTRDELKTEILDPNETCQHPEDKRVHLCGACGRRVN